MNMYDSIMKKMAQTAMRGTKTTTGPIQHAIAIRDQKRKEIAAQDQREQEEIAKEQKKALEEWQRSEQRANERETGRIFDEIMAGEAQAKARETGKIFDEIMAGEAAQKSRNDRNRDLGYAGGGAALGGFGGYHLAKLISDSTLAKALGATLGAGLGGTAGYLYGDKVRQQVGKGYDYLVG